MSKPTKKARKYCAPIVLDSAVEVAYNEVNAAAFADHKNRLESLKVRLENARARFTDPAEAEDEVQRIIAEDTAANNAWADRVREAERKLKDVTFKYWFTSVGRKKFVELIDANPPTDEDREEWDNAENKNLPAAVNELGFAKDLIAAASVTPRLSRGDVEEMFDDPAWNQAELTLLYMVARNAQLQV